MKLPCGLKSNLALDGSHHPRDVHLRGIAGASLGKNACTWHACQIASEPPANREDGLSSYSDKSTKPNSSDQAPRAASGRRPRTPARRVVLAASSPAPAPRTSMVAPRHTTEASEKPRGPSRPATPSRRSYWSSRPKWASYCEPMNFMYSCRSANFWPSLSCGGVFEQSFGPAVDPRMPGTYVPQPPVISQPPPFPPTPS
mmetsp:Transcript_17641/g.50295  ORF Transcript_17641/g.50295 Transcript_17641/m.50295 type:complete len:200 (+) Transcript_17641:97-696(+)